MQSSEKSTNFPENFGQISGEKFAGFFGEDFWEEFAEIFPKNSRILCGVSGGADSLLLVAVLDFLARKFPEKNLEIAALVCDHGLTPLPREILGKFFGKFPGVAWEVVEKSGAREKKTEAEFRARRFEKFAERIGAGNFAFLGLGHSLSDRVETTLLHLARGCEIPGFLGMRKIGWSEKIGAKIVRPLLGLTRERIREIAAASGIERWEDPSNADPEFSARNRVRLEILPGLKNLGQATAAGESRLELSLKKIWARVEGRADAENSGEKIQKKSVKKSKKRVREKIGEIWGGRKKFLGKNWEKKSGEVLGGKMARKKWKKWQKNQGNSGEKKFQNFEKNGARGGIRENLEAMPVSKFWGARGCRRWKSAEISDAELVAIWSALGAAENLRAETVAEARKILEKLGNGHFFVGGLHLRSQFGEIRRIRAPRFFWKNGANFREKLDAKSREKTWDLGWGGFVLAEKIGENRGEIAGENPAGEWEFVLGSEARVGSKSRRAWAKKQKIPIFWRDFVGLVVLDGQVRRAILPEFLGVGKNGVVDFGAKF